MPSLPTPQRILVIMLRRIGDVILTTPAVRALKNRYPEAQIDFMTEPPCHEVLQSNRHIHEVLVYEKPASSFSAAGFIDQLRWTVELRKKEYDWVIDFMGNPRSAFMTAFSGAKVKAGPGHVAHRWAYSHPMRQSPQACYAGQEKIRMMRSLGMDLNELDFLPQIEVLSSSKAWADLALKHTNGSSQTPLIGLIPSSRKITRRWPAENYAQLGRRLAEQARARIVVFWGPGEKALAEEVAQGIGPTAQPSPETRSLADLAALISRCRMVVTNCNGPKHIAVACGTPALTIHGSSDPASWNPPENPMYPFIRKEDLACIGCQLNQCPYHLECMREISPDSVTDKALELLARKSSSSPAKTLFRTP